MSTDTTDISRSLLLNGLRDVVFGTNSVIDGESRHRLERSFHAATTTGERGSFVTALHDIEEAREGRVDETTHATLQTTVDTVLEHLESTDTEITVHHESGADIAVRDVALYNFWQTRNPDALDILSFPPAVMNPLRDGGKAAAAGELGDAITSFDRAVTASSSTNAAIATRVLAALVAHWAADDKLALDYVEEALQLDSDAWPATMLGSVVRDDSSEAYREGSLSVQTYLRVRARIPDGAELRVRLGHGEQGETDWGEWTDALDCLPLTELTPHVRASFELTGPIFGLPALDAYYFAVGTVEPAGRIPRTTDHIFFDGPVTGDVTEELRIDSRSG